jgi:nucleotide-binding universal stress UspA family protein
VTEFSDDQLVDYLLGLGADGAIAEAVRKQPGVRRRCCALQSELGHLDEEMAVLLEERPRDAGLRRAPWRILLAVDGSLGSSGARRATEAARVLAQQNDGVVEVLHVCELAVGRCGAVLFGEERAEAAAAIGPVVGELRESGVSACAKLRSAPAGQVARYILWEAQETACDLIVIGASSPSRLAALRAPRVGAAVLRGADRPVLVA